MRRIFYIAIVLIAVFAACKSTSTVQNGSYKYLYDLESRDMHPEYVLYHFSDDSTTVHFRIQSTELLYARAGAQSPFVANLDIRCMISNVETAETDTTDLKITDYAKGRQGWLLGSFNIKMTEGLWNVLIDFTDVTKNLTQPTYVRADKSSTTSAQNYLVKKLSFNEPLFGGFAALDELVEITSARNAAKKSLYIHHLTSDIKLPPPPFSSNGPEIPSVELAENVTAQMDADGKFVLEVEGGDYFITHDSFKRTGYTLKTGSSFYPKVKDVSSLEWPLRYITTKTEYDQIIKNNYPKKMIDDFWLECAGSKERARDLIRIYYNRVEEANYYFSTYTDGWRTDRGMIHLVFGNPTKILKSTDTEIWHYGEEGTAGLLSFAFRRQESPLSNNVYILDRDPMFKQHWERMVTVWRNGRVYNE